MLPHTLYSPGMSDACFFAIAAQVCWRREGSGGFWTAANLRPWGLLQTLVRFLRSQYCPVESLALRRAALSIGKASAKAAERERG
jgi:hypothetical protein